MDAGRQRGAGGGDGVLGGQGDGVLGVGEEQQLLVEPVDLLDQRGQPGGRCADREDRGAADGEWQ